MCIFYPGPKWKDTEKKRKKLRVRLFSLFPLRWLFPSLQFFSRIFFLLLVATRKKENMEDVGVMHVIQFSFVVWDVLSQMTWRKCFWKIGFFSQVALIAKLCLMPFIFVTWNWQLFPHFETKVYDARTVDVSLLTYISKHIREEIFEAGKTVLAPFFRK